MCVYPKVTNTSNKNKDGVAICCEVNVFEEKLCSLFLWLKPLLNKILFYYGLFHRKISTLYPSTRSQTYKIFCIVNSIMFSLIKIVLSHSNILRWFKRPHFFTGPFKKQALISICFQIIFWSKLGAVHL